MLSPNDRCTETHSDIDAAMRPISTSVDFIHMTVDTADLIQAPVETECRNSLLANKNARACLRTSASENQLCEQLSQEHELCAQQ